MNNENNVHANELDSRIGDNHLDMMKAALPFMNVSQQRFISTFVKFNELQRTINLFEDGEVAAMGICSAGENKRSGSPLEMLNTIKPYANPSEQDLIDLFINIFQGFNLANAYSETVPSSTIPLQAQAQSQGPKQAQGDGQNRSNNANRQNNPFGKMPFEQLKNFMPPEQQSRLETMQMMMNAMQQMN
ncbi:MULTISPECIES: hypothetical protein [Lacrimispora]|jgi:hypothetical protein|uniref:hypothetical protein n=1 Tax=Lacrimispora TaxID=2719231 RepID=UPI000BE25D6A|nr:hypothetical protein [Lacrimispora amygdalina]MDK2967018.1 hypothetical protein [Lacrimispora sp.]